MPRRALWLGMGFVLMAAQGCAGPDVSRRPEARPGGIGTMALAVIDSIRPRDRPADAAAFVASPVTLPPGGASDAICGDPRILGERIAAIPGEIAGCGVDEPVRVSVVGGVRLSTPSIMDCVTAQALLDWVEEGVKPAVGGRGGGVAEFDVFAHYACRTRNSRPGAKISEHGMGHAIDIGGLVLNDGEKLSVLEGWRQRRTGRLLRGLHDSACDIFGTVLGPEADRHHRNHFHLDTARRRSGSYCR